MKKRFFLLLLISLLSLILTGCWDLRDIDQREIVIAIGIDFEEPIVGNNHSNYRMIRLTAQLAIPPRLGSGAGQEPGMGKDSVWNVSVVGRNMSMALNNLQERLQNEIFLAHVRVVVISEEVAREGINRYINFFKNSTEFRRLSYLIISECKAEKILNTFPKTTIIQGMFLMQMLENEIMRGTMPDIPIIEFTVRFLDKGIDPVAIMINSNDDILKYTGLAVLRGDRMVGKLDKEETWKFIQLSGNYTGGFEVVRNVRNELGYITIAYTNIDAHIRPIKEENDFLFKADIHLEGRILSQETTTDYSNEILFQQLEERVRNEAKKEIEAVYYKIQQQYDADILGFGERVKAYLPAEWNKIDNWREKFKKAKLEIEIEVKIRRVGMNL